MSIHNHRILLEGKPFDLSVNPVVTSSKVDGYGVGSKRIWYVSIDGGKNVSETIEILTALNEANMTMEYKVTNAPDTPFEGLVNKISVSQLQTGENKQVDSNKCSVEFIGTIKVDSEITQKDIEKILQETYDGILNGLKKLHD